MTFVKHILTFCDFFVLFVFSFFFILNNNCFAYDIFILTTERTVTYLTLTILYVIFFLIELYKGVDLFEKNKINR